MKKLLFTLSLAGLLSATILPAATLVTSNRAVVASATASGISAGPVLSRDGGTVTFLSQAPNLTTNPVDRTELNIYQYNRLNSNVVLISIATNASSGASGAYRWISTSSNGAFIAFVSDAADLVAGDTNDGADVFVRDVASGTTLLVSADTNGLPAPRNALYEFEPWSLNGSIQISADGRYVAFESAARSIVADSSVNTKSSVYLRDLQAGTTRLLSRTSTFYDLESKLMSMTPDTTQVAVLESGWGTTASVLLFVRNTTNSHMRSLTRLIDETPRSAIMSEDGQVVALTAVSANGTRLLTWNLPTDTIQNVQSNLATQSRTPFFISRTGQYVTYGDGTNVYRWDAAAQTNQAVNVTFDDGISAGGITELRSVDPLGRKIIFASDATNLVGDARGRQSRLYLRDMENGATHLIAIDAGSADASAPGAHISFDTQDGDLVPNDLNGAADVFLRDFVNGETTLVSRRLPERKAGTTGRGHARLYPGSLSSNGQFLAFTSYDSDLVPGDTNRVADAFVADLANGQVTQLGTNLGTVRAVNLTPDGRYALKVTTVADHGDDWIYRYDRDLGTEQFVARRSRGLGLTALAMSTDGSEVAYLASGFVAVTNLVTGQFWMHSGGGAVPVSTYEALFGPDQKIVYRTSSAIGLWDRATGSSTIVTTSPVDAAAVGGDNLYVVEYVDASIRALSRFNFTSKSKQRLYETSYMFTMDGLVVSATGTRLVGEIAQTPRQTFVYDLPTREFNILSTLANGTPGNAASADPQISGTGRYVVFVTRAANLVPNRSVPNTSALVVRDLLLGTTTLLVANAEGKSPNSHISKPIISADERTVGFQTVASDIVANDYNDRSDIFVLKLGSADSDGDGMDDDWEVAYFGNLTRNGSGDADEDGTSDLQEFLAGTNPTTSTSVFQVMTLSTVGGSGKQVVWTGNPDRSYRVEYKDNLNAAAWAALSGTPVWTGTTATVLDPASTSSRFYRVVRLP